MKKPITPPSFSGLLQAQSDLSKVDRILELAAAEKLFRHYLHWEKLRRYAPPAGFTHQEWWLALKIQRIGLLKPLALQDKDGHSFKFCVPELVQEELHQIDLGAGATLNVPEPITNPQTRDQYLVRSLMEEAITSSQLEGAATTREVAKEMIRTGRPPRDVGEQMILNNYATMRRIIELKNEPLSPALVFEIHRCVTDKTLDDPAAAGRLRRPDEKRVVGDDRGEVYHDPPPAEQLETRLTAMCAFANAQTPGYFVHPVVRAISLHFWLAYDHPFVDGNGRTASALFYWAMLHRGYWLFEFISISHILKKAPIKYARSFLYTETDDNDLTYFIVAQTRVIRRAISELHEYIDRKTAEVRLLESRVRVLNSFNYRQVNLIRHALKHPHQEYTIESHRKSHEVVYQTARTDLLGLHQRGLLELKKRGKQMVFAAPCDFSKRLQDAEKTMTK